MTWLTELLKTATGKTIAGVVIATSSVGAAAAAGAPVPLLVEDEAGPPADEPAEPVADEPSDEGATDDGTADDGDDASDEGDDGDEADEGGEAELAAGELSADAEDENHGAVVSEFARTTDLEGCAKGQAVAAVARGDVDPASLTLADDLATFTAKCGDDEDELLESADGTDGWKDTRDQGREAVDLAQSAYDERCGDDDEADDDGDDGVGAGVTPLAEDGTDAATSEECEALHQAAKDARSEWKDDWKSERDAEHEAKRAEHHQPSGDDGESSGRRGGKDD